MSRGGQPGPEHPRGGNGRGGEHSVPEAGFLTHPLDPRSHVPGDSGIAPLMASEALSAAARNDFVDRCA